MRQGVGSNPTPYDACVRPTPPPPPGLSRFSRLARTHAAIAAGDAAMAVALADSVLFSLDADAARGRVLLFLGISFVPFLFVAPFIGPIIDRTAGGRRFVIQVTALVRAALAMLMAFHIEGLLLFPLAFGAMVMQKTYAVSKSALVPSVVRSEEELVEANSKLGLISGLVGFAAVVPAAMLQKTLGAKATLLYAALIFVVGFLSARRLPKETIAPRSPNRRERVELHSDRVVLAATAMMLMRASVGFTFFHLFFWFRAQEAGLAWFGLSLGFAGLMTLVGNIAAPKLRLRVREESMMAGALAVIAATGLVATMIGGVVAGLLLAGMVNFAAVVGRLAFESIVQHDAPDANRGRAFAQFETRFQLGWVMAGLVPVIIQMPGQFGFVLVGVAALAELVLYLVSARALRAGHRPPHPFMALRRAVLGDRRSARPATPRIPPPPPRASHPGAPRR
ncbi:MAG: hypothetical protein RLZZ623_3129 [Actinomycetota bacterium]